MSMWTRRTLVAAVVPMAITARPQSARAAVKGFRPPSVVDAEPADAYPDPAQYDIEQLMGEVEGLRRRMDGNDLAFNLLAIQVMITGVFAAWTRHS